MKWVVRLAVIVLAVALGAVFLLVDAKPNLYRTSAQKGIEWLLQYPDDYKNIGVFWALKEINLQSCHSDEFEKKILERFESIPRSEVERAYFSFPNTTVSEGARIATTSGRYDRWLLEALSCKEQPLSEKTKNEVQSGMGTKGYDRTHAYLALLYLQRLGCDTEIVPLETSIATVEEALSLEEKQAGSFSDLSAERAAFLLWGGRHDLVDEGWVARIRSAQGPEGSWADGQTALPNPHSTALATWALAQASGQCPL